jgi:hypothetical protein
LIIAAEIALGIAVLQNQYIKRFIIPVTIGLLAIFCIHLSMEMYKHGAMNGNCGCFGQWLPMTPLEAFLKNIVTIGLLIYLYRNVTETAKEQSKFGNLLALYFGTALVMFMFFEKTPSLTENTTKEVSLPSTVEMPKIIEEPTQTVIAKKDTTSVVNGTEKGNVKVIEEKKEEKKVSKSGNDKFQPDPELNSQIIRTE